MEAAPVRMRGRAAAHCLSLIVSYHNSPNVLLTSHHSSLFTIATKSWTNFKMSIGLASYVYLPHFCFLLLSIATSNHAGMARINDALPVRATLRMIHIQISVTDLKSNGRLAAERAPMVSALCGTCRRVVVTSNLVLFSEYDHDLPE